MRYTFKLLGGAVIAALLASACGETKDEPGGLPPKVAATPVSSKDFPQRFAAAHCDNIASCCRAGGIAYDPSTCRTTMEGYVGGIVAAATTSGRAVFDQVVAGACISAYTAALAECTNQAAFDSADTSCQFIFKGTVSKGGQCSQDFECLQGSPQATICDQGICTANVPSSFDQPRAKLGDACSSTCLRTSPNSTGCGSSSGSGTATGGSCWVNDGLACANGVCGAAPRLGEACSFYCAMGAFCDLGKCVPQRTSGPCTNDECDSSAYCDFTTHTCNPKKVDGAACGDGSQCINGDCSASRCRAWSYADTFSCSGLPN